MFPMAVPGWNGGVQNYTFSFKSVAEWQTFFHKVCSHTTLFNVSRFVQSIPCLYDISFERVVDWVSIVMLRPCALSII